MKQLPSTEDLVRIGISIHDHGFEANEQLLVEVSELARQVRPDWPVLDIVPDRAHPEVVRARAFSRLTADWEEIRTELESFRLRFEADLSELLATWNAHQDLRKTNAAIADLADSRARLDRLRIGIGRRREVVSP